jgi:thiamine-monophosphate kinase
VDEFELIRRYFLRQDQPDDVVTGIGDDGAVLRPSPGKEFVTVVDTLVAGTHFPESIDPADIGYRAVAVNLSDMAAMAALPRWMTLALTLREAEPSWLERFASGLHEAAREHGVALVGGDTTRGQQLVVSVQVSGEVDTGAALLRSGARPGDTIFVTGTPGDAAAGLEQLDADKRDDYLVSRFLRPTARVDAGLALAGVAHAAIDVSDGLIADLDKLLEASGVGAEVDVERIPLSPAILDYAGRERALQYAMGGGDDYELCFTLPRSRLPAQLTCTAIGRITAGGGLKCFANGELVTFDSSGYRHFR